MLIGRDIREENLFWKHRKRKNLSRARSLTEVGVGSRMEGDESRWRCRWVGGLREAKWACQTVFWGPEWTGQGRAGPFRSLTIENKASDSQWEKERPDGKNEIARHQRKTRGKWRVAQLGIASPTHPPSPCWSRSLVRNPPLREDAPSHLLLDITKSEWGSGNECRLL